MSRKNKNRSKTTIKPPQGNQVESTAEIVVVLTECQLERVDWAVTELVRDQKINVDRSDVIAKCVDAMVDKVVLSFLGDRAKPKSTKAPKPSANKEATTDNTADAGATDKVDGEDDKTGQTTETPTGSQKAA